MNNTATKDYQSPKFLLIVDTSTTLFMRYGIKRITIEEICKTASVSKMTFYKYFNNKIDLAEYIIFSIIDDAQIQFDSIWKQLTPFEQKISKFIKLKIEYSKKFSKEFFIDFMNLSPQIHDKILGYSKNNQSYFIKMVEEAQKSGSVRSDISINFMTFMLNKFMEITEDEKFINLYNNTEELTLDMMNFYFYGIMGKNK